MCTVIVLRRPGHAWPLVIAANRDERLDRAWDPPAAHWPDLPDVVGGRDRSAGGTWMAARGGVVATVLNRPGSLGPAPGKRSRGELPLLAVDNASAEAAASRMVELDAGQWRPFNMVIADAQGAFFLRGLGAGRPERTALPAGISMVTAHDPNDLSSPRTARHLPRFRAAAAPEPDADDWAAWEELVSDSGFGTEGIGGALNVPPVNGFGTVCSSLLSIGFGGGLLWRFCAAPPRRGGFLPIGTKVTAP